MESNETERMTLKMKNQDPKAQKPGELKTRKRALQPTISVKPKRAKTGEA